MLISDEYLLIINQLSNLGTLAYELQELTSMTNKYD